MTIRAVTTSELRLPRSLGWGIAMLLSLAIWLMILTGLGWLP